MHQRWIPVFGLAVVVLLIAGCANNHLVFGTYTEFNVAAVEARPTGDVALKVGYDRGEVAYVPDNGGDGYAVFGNFESDIRMFSGYYLHEIFATGEAANIASADIAGAGDYVPRNYPPAKPEKPLLLTTGTRFGFHCIFAVSGQSATPVDVLLGYKRANYTVVPTIPGAAEARSVYADLVVGEGSRRARAAEKTGAPSQSAGIGPSEGLVISQRIATGTAARHLARNEEIQRQLLYGAGDLTAINDLTDELKAEMAGRSGEDDFAQARQQLAVLADLDPQTISRDNFIRITQANLDADGMRRLLSALKGLP